MLPPDTFLQQRYRILRPLKQGGMGTVYEAVDERLDSTVALKECHFAEEPLRKQFEREARLLAHLRHSALTKVIDHFGEPVGQFLVMEFIPGDDLSELMQRRNGPLPQAEVLTWADQLLDALDYLHTHDPPIVHRDIKPQNLKLTKRGQVILLDFGLAKGSTGQRPQTKTPDSIFGYTLNYAPLEQIQGKGTDPRSDLYSLAATLYHLLTAQVPPDVLTRIAALANKQPDPLLPTHTVNSEVSPAVSEILTQAMSPTREKRPPSAARMRELLRAAVPPPVTASSKFRWWVAVPLLVMLLVGFAIINKLGGPPSTWETVSEAGFFVEMPVAPEKQTQTVDTPAGPIEIILFTSEASGEAFIVGYNDFPEAAANLAKPDQVVNSARDGAIKNVNGKITSEHAMTVGNYPGIEFVGDATTPMEGTFIARVYWIKPRLYQILYVHKKGSDVSENGQKFLESFKLTQSKR